MKRKISTGRKGVYYTGMFLGVIGLLVFGSIFISGALHFGDFSDFEARGQSMGIRAAVGMGLMILARSLVGIGRTGLAGSGLVLDPDKARHDIEPWARMGGGVVKDALDEAGIGMGKTQGGAELSFDEQLRKLHKLREDGIISEDEYQMKKKKILEA
jgi:hypothetical protein